MGEQVISIGRIVVYKCPNDGTLDPAIAMSVNEDGTANIMAFGLEGTRAILSVTQGDGLGEWEWPRRVS